MTVKEALKVLGDPETVYLIWDGNQISFNFRCDVEVEAWGDFLISGIFARAEREFEIVLEAHPIRKTVTA